MKRGRPRVHNPVAKRVREILKLNPSLTLEKIAVACDIKFNTLRNIFTRDTVSYMTLAGLRYGGIIDQKDEKEYMEWIKRRKSRSKTSRTRSKSTRKVAKSG